ncbi:MAG TPA: hypothetical protein VHJ82_00265 [Actinomycetota bacterium]|nr:hypothetical protein [Actinomycetota bacterium]
MRTAVGISVLAALLVGLITMPRASAEQRKKTVTEEWQATAAPYPGADDHSDPATECGLENLTFTIHTFTTPAKGTLEARLSDFQGEWDLYVTDTEGRLLASSVNFMAGPQEQLTVPLPAKLDIEIYACNFLGGPTAQGALTYTYKQ